MGNPPKRAQGGQAPLMGNPPMIGALLPALYGGDDLAEPGHAEIKRKGGRPPLWGTPQVGHKGGRPPLWGTPQSLGSLLPALSGCGGLAKPGHAEIRRKVGRPPLWGTP